MGGWTEMVCKVTCQIVVSRPPVVFELLAVLSVSHEPVVHFCRFSCFELYVFGDKPQRSCVVSLDGGGGLSVPHLLQQLPFWDSLLQIDV